MYSNSEILMARSLRLAVIQNQYDQGNLTEDDAKELLSGPLTPGDDNSVFTRVECWQDLDGQHFAHFDKCGGDRKHRLTTDEVGELAETLAAEGWVIDWSQCVPGNFAAHPPEWAAERARWEAAHPDPDPGVA